MEVSYESIEPNVAEAEQDGSTMRCRFRCPVTGQEISAEGDIQESESMGAVAKRSALGSVLFSLRWWIRRLLYNLFGHNVGGMLASDVADGVAGAATDRVEDRASGQERKDAIVRAFQSVQDQFTWDAERQRWVVRVEQPGAGAEAGG